MDTISILTLTTIISVIISIYCVVKKVKRDSATEKINKQIKIEKDKLQQDVYELLSKKDNLKIQNSSLDEQNKLLQDNIDSTFKNQEKLSRQAFENFWEVLENSYKEKQKEYEDLSKTLENAYSNKQLQLIKDIDKCEQELEKIRSTRAAAMEAQRKEQEIKEQLAFYCLSTSKNDLDDIKKLERIKPDLHNPRILSMLIWSTYFQKPMNALCKNVLGTEVVTGIYKITNQENNMCYIGQTVN